MRLIGPDHYTGEIRCQVRLDDDDTAHITVQRADPRSTITAELMERLRAGTADITAITPLRVDVTGNMISIHADNGDWLYQVVGYDAERELYLVEWPD